MTKREKDFCLSLLKFQEKGIRPLSAEIWNDAKMPRMTFYVVRDRLIEAGIVSRHDRSSLIEYSLNKKAYQKALNKKKEPTLRELAKKYKVSYQTISNWKKKGKL